MFPYVKHKKGSEFTVEKGANDQRKTFKVLQKEGELPIETSLKITTKSGCLESKFKEMK